MTQFPAFTVFDESWYAKIPAGHYWIRDFNGDLVVYSQDASSLPMDASEVARFRDGEWTHVVRDFPE